MTAVDIGRIEAARVKRLRKLERYTNTPHAKVRRAELEAMHAAGKPIPPPDPEIVDMSE